MKIKYRDLLAAMEGLAVIENADLPYIKAYGISKTLEEIRNHVKEYNNEHAKLVDKYVLRDKKGNYVYLDEKKEIIKLNPDTFEEFEKNQLDLGNFEVDINVYQLSEADVEKVNIKPGLVASIDFIIDHENVEE